MNPAIRVDHLAKEYRIGSGSRSYRTLRESLSDSFKASCRLLMSKPKHRGAEETIWALNDVSFEVKPGEVVGLIGRNGAGKSTLLKLLSRITEPTSGHIEIRGRMGSLLEVGTGFHPELTGRENIYMNGSILGMSRREIRRRFDEIVAFSEIERFLDTPVKRYSSGMYVRLAFAVAAHLEPEILLVDEVLAVGDASFQKKCLNKMEDVGGQGRTVLFVSHNMPAVTRLCPRAVLLAGGKIVADGPTARIIRTYCQSSSGTMAKREWHEPERIPGTEVVRLRSVRIRDTDNKTVECIDIRRPVGIEMTFDVLKSGHELVPNFHVYNEDGVCVFVVSDKDPKWLFTERPEGRFISTAWIPGNYLAEGTLLVHAAISTIEPIQRIHVRERDAVAFQVMDPMEPDSARANYRGDMPGIVRPLLNWTTEYTTRC
jgi:homopolymeric O-antigen transport system ATP-binding protein